MQNNSNIFTVALLDEIDEVSIRESNSANRHCPDFLSYMAALQFFSLLPVPDQAMHWPKHVISEVLMDWSKTLPIPNFSVIKLVLSYLLNFFPLKQRIRITVVR